MGVMLKAIKQQKTVIHGRVAIFKYFFMISPLGFTATFGPPALYSNRYLFKFPILWHILES